MTRNSLAPAALVAALTLMSAPSLAGAATPVGTWLDHSGRGAVEIKPCGKALCGYVVAVSSTRDNKGCGKQIIGGTRSIGGNLWGGGWIYSPERRKTFDVELKPLDNGTLRVVGFAGIKLFSRTMIWKPAPADLARCDRGADAVVTEVNAPAATEPTSESVAAKTTTAAIEPVVPPPSKNAELSKATPTEARNPEASEARAPAPAQQAVEPPAAEADAETVPASETPVGDEEQAAEAAADTDAAVDAGPPAPRERGLDLGGLNLEKILTKTKSGKCKIDLPWVKLTVDCNTD